MHVILINPLTNIISLILPTQRS